MIRKSLFFISVVLLCLGVGLPTGAAEESVKTAIADNPEVQNAVSAWLEWVEYQLAINGVPGASVAIVHDQELIVARGIGMANPQTEMAAAPDTIYSICSISKLFSSISLMQQYEQGKLRLDDPVSEHLDWFNLEDVHPNDHPTTIRGLLTHSSGLPRESDYPYWSDPNFIFPTREEIRLRLADQQSLYPASRYFQYSNLAMTLVGEIVAERSGTEFGSYVEKNILGPLGMSSTFTEIPKEHAGGRLALGYSARNRDGLRDVMPLFQARGIRPAAGFASTVEDLARFASWQFRLLSSGETELLKASTLREMQRVHWVDPNWRTTWGLGFSVRRAEDKTRVGHGGACPGYYSQFLLEPKSKLGAIVLSNAMGAETGFYAEQAIELVGPAVKAAQNSDKKPIERDPDLDRYVGIYHSSWGESAILRWKNGLADMGLRTRNPKRAITRLEKIGEHTFRRVRDDDDSPGEVFVFEVDDEGAVTRVKQHSNWAVKVR
ncbi:MAG: serine hydrolase [bacterium]|nr:serine hydrolase [bacterium]